MNKKVYISMITMFILGIVCFEVGMWLDVISPEAVLRKTVAYLGALLIVGGWSVYLVWTVNYLFSRFKYNRKEGSGTS